MFIGVELFKFNFQGPFSYDFLVKKRKVQPLLLLALNHRYLDKFVILDNESLVLGNERARSSVGVVAYLE